MNNCSKKLVQLTLFLCLAAGAALGAVTPTPTPTTKPTPMPPHPAAPMRMPRIMTVPGFPPPANTEGETSEKSIAVAPGVSLKMCISDGQLKVNGWDRNEIRLFVKDGTKAGFRVLEKDGETGKPVWLLVSNQSGPHVGAGSECISGDIIEMDVPVKTSLTVKARSSQATVDLIRKIDITNVEGNVSLRNISGGISAVALRGDLTVENSSGEISVETTTGNIVAYEVSPGQVGDLFRAKTNSGTITLQKVDHRQIEANSITGSVLFDGKFRSGGLYNFKTSNGSIRMLIPDDSSCTFKAAYGYGNFKYELPLKVVTENVTSGGKNVVATLGAGDATVNLTTSSGSIGIRKQQ